VPLTEEWPVRPAARLFYAQEKAEIEELLDEEAAAHPELELYVLRPPIVLGPHAVGAKEVPLPGPLAPLGRRLVGLFTNAPIPLLTAAPNVPVQFIHEADVGRAFLQCIVSAGPPGAYNITGDGVLTMAEVMRAAGWTTVPLPAGPVHATFRALSAVPLPFAPPAAQWIEALSHPSIMDASKAKRELGWAPTYTSRDALRATLNDQRA
jgi:nucleoside-diphosphate-sugar epimerase